MRRSLLSESSAAFKHVFAAQLGCAPEAFEQQGLTVVERPADSWEPAEYVGIVAECGLGSIVSVRDGRLGDWAREQPLERHYRIFLPSFLEGMAAGARELGHEGAKSHSPSVGMVLAEDVPVPPVPEGLRLVELPPSQQDELRKTGEFENALCEKDEHDKLARFRRAMGLVEPGGTVVGVSGVWEQYPGIDEIGLDIRREWRGRGLAPLLTLEATRSIRDAGRWPIYTFGVTNLRSQNNGLRCGYRPLWMLSVVYVPDS